MIQNSIMAHCIENIDLNMTENVFLWQLYKGEVKITFLDKQTLWKWHFQLTAKDKEKNFSYVIED